MSSASKRFRGAGVAGVSALIAVTSFLAAAPALAAPAAGGQIGVVDKGGVSTPSVNNGATLVTAGANGQMLGDVRLLIPNSFAKGDTVDLQLSAATAGFNSSADALGFTSAPSVNVDSKAYTSALMIDPVTDTTTNNTEHGDRTASTDTTDVAPAFTTTLEKSVAANGLANDIVRLKFTGDSKGTATDKWVITLSGAGVKAGDMVAHGEIKLTPTSGTIAFGGEYTTPAYVSAAQLSVGSPSNVVGDGTAQNIGNITIAETNNSGLDQGTSEDYTVTLGGSGNATLANNNTDNKVAVKLVNPATGQEIGAAGTADDYAVVNPGNKSVTFTLNSANATAAKNGKVSIVLSNLQVESSGKGNLTYTLSGGDLNFGPDAAANQTDIQISDSKAGLEVDGLVTPLVTRIGGADRYQTAAKIALAMASDSDKIVLASGETFPDALSSSYLASTVQAPTLLTTKNSLPEATRDALRQLTGWYSGQYSYNQKTVYVIGGTGAISDAVVNDLRNNVYGKLNVIRLGGTDRYATNKVVNEYTAKIDGVARTQTTYGKPGAYTAMVASGEGFADAVAAAPATAAGIPLILTRSGSLSAAAGQQLDDFNIGRAIVLGGNGAVSSATESAIAGHGAKTERLAGSDRFETATKVADWELGQVTPDATHSGGGLGWSDNTAFLANGLSFADALAGGAMAGLQESPMLLATTNDLTKATTNWLTDNAAQYDTVVGLGLAGAISNAVLQQANNIVVSK